MLQASRRVCCMPVGVSCTVNAQGRRRPGTLGYVGRISRACYAAGRRAGVALLVLGSLLLTALANAAPGYRVLGQPTLDDTMLASRCPDVNAQFNFSAGMYGPSGIAVDPR